MEISPLRPELTPFLEPDEHVTFSTEDEALFAHSALKEAWLKYFIFSSIFWLALIGNIYQCMGPTEINDTLAQRMILCSALIVIVAILVWRNYPKLKQRERETTSVLTNKRYFKAPSSIDERWLGPADSSIWFANTLFVGKSKNQRYIVFAQPNPYTGETDQAILNRLMPTRRLDAILDHMPKYLKVEEPKYLTGESFNAYRLRITRDMNDRNKVQRLEAKDSTSLRIPLQKSNSDKR